MSLVLGIDPGQKGACVWLRSGLPVRAERMPAKPKVGLDLAAVRDWLEELRPDHVVLERAQAMPKQGIASTAAYMKDYGALLGILCALRIPHETISPAVWHRSLCGSRAKGEDKSQAKARALQVVRQRLPTLEVVPKGCRVPHDGIVDAACLALYGATS